MSFFRGGPPYRKSVRDVTSVGVPRARKRYAYVSVGLNLFEPFDKYARILFVGIKSVISVCEVASVEYVDEISPVGVYDEFPFGNGDEKNNFLLNNLRSAVENVS